MVVGKGASTCVMPSSPRVCSLAVAAGPMFRGRKRPAFPRRMAPSFVDPSYSPTSGSRTMGRRRDRTTRRVATSKNAGTMMRMSVGMIGGASGLMYGVAYHLMYGVAYHLMYRVANRLIYGVANHLMSAGVNGRARGVTEIVATAQPLR